LKHFYLLQQSKLINLNGVFKQYSGSAPSGVTGNVVITLNTEVDLTATKYINVSCDLVTNAVPASSCNVVVDYLDIDDSDVTIFSGTLLSGEVRRVGLPAQIINVYEDDRFDIRADATVGNDFYYSRTIRRSLSGVIDGESFNPVLILNGGFGG
jgi:hypothetical protein